MSCYKILGLNEGSSLEQIQNNYKLIRSKILNELKEDEQKGFLAKLDKAYEILLNKTKKSYDKRNYSSYSYSKIQKINRKGKYVEEKERLETNDERKEYHNKYKVDNKGNKTIIRRRGKPIK